MSIHALYTASTGMDAQLKNIDTIANNVANLETQGFRRDRVNFADLFYRQEVLPGGATTGQASSPTGIHVGHGVKVVSTEKVFEPGGLVPTENPYHVAIQGGNNLFFRIDRANGTTAYTRAGNFTLNENRAMVTPGGDPLGVDFVIPQEADSITIRPDGMVLAGSETLPAEEIGQINLVRFTNPAGLVAGGDNLFYESRSSGEPVEIQPGLEGRLLQRHVEGSNVQAIKELVNLIKGQRAYEINSNVIQTADEALQIANNLRA